MIYCVLLRCNKGWEMKGIGKDGEWRCSDTCVTEDLIGQIIPWFYKDVGLPMHLCQAIFSTHKPKYVAISSNDTDEVQPRS